MYFSFIGVFGYLSAMIMKHSNVVSSVYVYTNKEEGCGLLPTIGSLSPPTRFFTDPSLRDRILTVELSLSAI